MKILIPLLLMFVSACGPINNVYRQAGLGRLAITGHDLPDLSGVDLGGGDSGYYGYEQAPRQAPKQYKFNTFEGTWSYEDAGSQIRFNAMENSWSYE